MTASGKLILDFLFSGKLSLDQTMYYKVASGEMVAWSGRGSEASPRLPTKQPVLRQLPCFDLKKVFVGVEAELRSFDPNNTFFYSKHTLSWVGGERSSFPSRPQQISLRKQDKLVGVGAGRSGAPLPAPTLRPIFLFTW